MMAILLKRGATPAVQSRALFSTLQEAHNFKAAQMDLSSLPENHKDRRFFKSYDKEINSQFILEPTFPLSRESKRVGLLGYKIGMTHYWDKWGVHVPCTVIQIDRCQVIQVKQAEKDGVNSMQVGCGEVSLKHLVKPQAGHFLKYNLPPKRDLVEFQVSPENMLPIGYMLSPLHFKIG